MPRALARRLRGRSRVIEKRESATLSADFLLETEGGEPVARIEGMQFARASAAQAPRYR